MDSYVKSCEVLGVSPLQIVCDALTHSVSSGEPLTLHLAGNTVPIQTLKRRLNDSDIQAALEGVAKARLSLFALSCGYNDITDVGIRTWGGLLSSLGLHLLDVSSCNITADGCVALTEELIANATELQALTLDYNPIGDGGGTAAAKLISTHPRIASVSLSHCELGIDALIHISTALESTHTLQVLDLSNPRLSSRNEEAAYHLARALRVNRSLTTLRLRKFPHWTESSVSSLFDYLLDNDGAVSELDLSGTRLAGPSGVIIAKALEAGAGLRTLRLSHCRIGDEGAVALATALVRGCSLRELDVRHNSIGDVGLCALAESIVALTTPEGDETAVSALDVLLVAGNELAAGRIGTTNLGQLLLDTATTCQLDVRPYMVDGVVHLGIE